MTQGTTAIACTLKDSDMRNRLKMVHEKLLPHVIARAKLEHGQQLTFLGGHELRPKLEAFIEFEKRCCSFLDFELSESSEANRLILQITGPEDTKGFLAEGLT